MKNTLLTLLLCASLFACDRQPIDKTADEQGHSAATSHTQKANRAVAAQLPLADSRDRDNAVRGLMAAANDLVIKGENGQPIWTLADYDFIDGPAPDTVNPSLWRQEGLNNIGGLFQVADGIYQLRGFDLANLTLIDGDTGWIVVDPLMTKETAAAAMAFARQQLPSRPVSAVIYTHSHIDHFGGVLGVVNPDDVHSGKVRVYAPEGFFAEATSENIIAGTTMSRRATYMYGQNLAVSARGHIGVGLGKAPAFGGSSGVLAPTDIIDKTPQPMNIDGVEFVFQNVPESEAPAELMFYLPKYKAFCGGEVVSQVMHNLYTLRGAKVRDALKWSGYIDEALKLFADAEIYFGSHHWPLWGNAEIVDFLKKQRDTYKYIHDQTLRMAAQGLTPGEIAEQLTMPESLRSTFSSRGYYGTVKHNARAVYQAYFGWYDAHPANLDPLPPEQAAVRYVKMMGGADAVLEQAQGYFDEGDYRWVAEILKHLVFADPNNAQAKALLAKTFDQLGYQAESGPWRGVYLSAAYELRHGIPEIGFSVASATDMLRQVPIARFLDLVAASINGEEADGKHLLINFVFPDRNESHVLEVENAVLHHRQQPPAENANATLTISHSLFLKLMTGSVKLSDLIGSDDISIDGSKIDLARFFALIDKPNERFNIVLP